MNGRTKWGLGFGLGIPGVLILIGLIALLTKFFMKRCRKKAWIEIPTMPTHFTSSLSFSSENGTGGRKKNTTWTSSECEPLCQSTTDHTLEISDTHIGISIGNDDLPSSQRDLEQSRQHQHSLNQIRRERLDRLKAESLHLRPMPKSSEVAQEMQRVIEQVRREFDESE
jgi:hypothetical protein